MANFIIVFEISALIFLALLAARETFAVPAGSSEAEDNRDDPAWVPPSIPNNTRSILSTQSNDQCWLNDPARNEKIVHDFFKRVYEGQEVNLLNYYFDENVELTSNGVSIKTRDAFKEGLLQSFSDGIRATLEIKSSSSEAQSVWSHVHVTTYDSSQPNYIYAQGYVWQFYFNCYGQVDQIYFKETGFFEGTII